MRFRPDPRRLKFRSATQNERGNTNQTATKTTSRACTTADASPVTPARRNA